jgi:hypothetical protein
MLEQAELHSAPLVDLDGLSGHQFVADVDVLVHLWQTVANVDIVPGSNSALGAPSTRSSRRLSIAVSHHYDGGGVCSQAGGDPI